MSRKHLVYLILILVVLAVVMAWILVLSPFIPAGFGASGDSRTVELDGNAISVLVADTDASRRLGLGGRASLGADEGMLFIFPVDGRYAFWMKDMRFSIDILWISADDTIVYMAQNVAPDTYPHSFVSPTPARDVLELPAGYAAAHGVSVGDKVQL